MEVEVSCLTHSTNILVRPVLKRELRCDTSRNFAKDASVLLIQEGLDRIFTFSTRTLVVARVQGTVFSYQHDTLEEVQRDRKLVAIVDRPLSGGETLT